MPVAASQILDFLEQQESFTIKRHEIALAEFGMLRRSLRQIVLKLRESDDNEALRMAEALRALISEWLTTPVTFDRSMGNYLTDILGDPSAFESRWGRDIATLYETARHAAAKVQVVENPMRRKLIEIIQKLRTEGLRFMIYCHRRARPHFESVFASVEDLFVLDDIFLHSVREYRDSSTFDVLIKTGPLRSRGWGSAPDALVTAPRFSTLELIVWSGCADEPGFGYDPCKSSHHEEGAAHFDGERTVLGFQNWRVQVSRTGEDPIAAHDVAEWDELLVFTERKVFGDKRSAKLVQMNQERGIFYPPYSRILSYNPIPGSRQPVDWRIPGETLVEGMFVIVPSLDDVDFGGLQARHGDYSQIWKARLQAEVRADSDGLIERLRSAGLDLMHLGSAVKNWCRAPRSVIHAPQRSGHFEILLRVLGIDDDQGIDGARAIIPWWKRAWMEIRRSRGEAIQAGHLEQELVDEHLLTVLEGLLLTIKDEVSLNHAFDLALPETSGMTGVLHFYPVTGIEDGFSVPDAELRVVHRLNVIDQWRD
jgi:hypothetical protein